MNSKRWRSYFWRNEQCIRNVTSWIEDGHDELPRTEDRTGISGYYRCILRFNTHPVWSRRRWFFTAHRLSCSIARKRPSHVCRGAHTHTTFTSVLVGGQVCCGRRGSNETKKIPDMVSSLMCSFFNNSVLVFFLSSVWHISDTTHPSNFTEQVQHLFLSHSV